MKTCQTVIEDGENLDTPDDFDGKWGPFGIADWNDGPDTVLEGIDKLLEPHGLEVITFDTGADMYMFSIKPREA